MGELQSRRAGGAKGQSQQGVASKIAESTPVGMLGSAVEKKRSFCPGQRLQVLGGISGQVEGAMSYLAADRRNSPNSHEIVLR